MCSRDIKEGDIIEEHNYRTSQNKVGWWLSRWRIVLKMGLGGVLPLFLPLCRPVIFLSLCFLPASLSDEEASHHTYMPVLKPHPILSSIASRFDFFFFFLPKQLYKQFNLCTIHYHITLRQKETVRKISLKGLKSIWMETYMYLLTSLQVNYCASVQ